MYPSVRWCSTIKVLCSVHQMKQLGTLYYLEKHFFSLDENKTNICSVQVSSVIFFALQNRSWLTSEKFIDMLKMVMNTGQMLKMVMNAGQLLKKVMNVGQMFPPIITKGMNKIVRDMRSSSLVL